MGPGTFCLTAARTCHLPFLYTYIHIYVKFMIFKLVSQQFVLGPLLAGPLTSAPWGLKVGVGCLVGHPAAVTKNIQL